MPNVKEFDFVVVGAGASGCVAANRLSADSHNKVLVLEAGHPDNSPDVRNLTGFVGLWGGELDWQFETSKQAGLSSRKVPFTQGKLCGGGSSIHAMMYVRGNRRNFDLWSAQGNDGWSYREVLPYFKKSENFEGGESAYHGVGGLLSVRTAPDASAVSAEFQNAAVALGYGGPDWDYNGERQEDGAGPLQFNITRDNKRSSASSAFLTPVLDRQNLTLKTRAEATRLLLEGNKAVGVEYLQDGETVTVRARREVLVCAGPFLSPKLLMLSGIGPADQLTKLGIPVVSALPGVGQNLQDHLQLPVIYRAKAKTPSPTVLSGNVLFTRSRSNMQEAAPDCQIIYSAGVPTALAGAFKFEFPVSIFVTILVQPYSRGSVRLRSANPEDTPIIDPNYLDSATDLQTLIRAMEIVRGLAKTQAFSDRNDGEIVPGPDAGLEDFIRANASTIWHPVGTCRMGRDAQAVVDQELKVHGLEQLRIVDASIMPQIPSGNTFAACVMIGEKASDMILG